MNDKSLARCPQCNIELAPTPDNRCHFCDLRLGVFELNNHPWSLRLIWPIGILISGVLLGWDFGWILAAANAHPVLGTLIFIACLGSMWWMTLGVHQVEIDLISRTYFLQTGVWPFTAGFSGTLEDFELRVKESHVQNRHGTHFFVGIDLAWKDNFHLPLSLWSNVLHGRESLKSIVPEARVRAQNLAEQLQIPLRP